MSSLQTEEDQLLYIRSELERYNFPRSVIANMIRDRFLWCRAHNTDPRNYYFTEHSEQVEYKMQTVFKWEPKDANIGQRSNTPTKGGTKRG